VWELGEGTVADVNEGRPYSVFDWDDDTELFEKLPKYEYNELQLYAWTWRQIYGTTSQTGTPNSGRELALMDVVSELHRHAVIHTHEREGRLHLHCEGKIKVQIYRLDGLPLSREEVLYLETNLRHEAPPPTKRTFFGRAAG
jgi:hypothetical protein